VAASVIARQAMPMPAMVTVFRSRLRDEHEDYEATADEMEAAARAMPGFVDFKSFVADDGERVSLVVFDSPESHAAWRDDPRHREAQQRGRADWYSEYLIQVCALVDERRFQGCA
jgi:heme-degrading monooxygenase HmoA